MQGLVSIKQQYPSMNTFHETETNDRETVKAQLLQSWHPYEGN